MGSTRKVLQLTTTLCTCNIFISHHTAISGLESNHFYQSMDLLVMLCLSIYTFAHKYTKYASIALSDTCRHTRNGYPCLVSSKRHHLYSQIIRRTRRIPPPLTRHIICTKETEPGLTISIIFISKPCNLPNYH